MNRTVVSASILAMALATALSGTAHAGETGVASIHSWVKVGRKTCMLDHYHSGNGSGRTRAEAQRAAIRDWVGFTAWEYGSSWASYSLAVSKSMKCDRSSDGYSCNTDARACRGY
jgi:hypothetical protein